MDTIYKNFNRIKKVSLDELNWQINFFCKNFVLWMSWMLNENISGGMKTRCFQLKFALIIYTIRAGPCAFSALVSMVQNIWICSRQRRPWSFIALVRLLHCAIARPGHCVFLKNDQNVIRMEVVWRVYIWCKSRVRHRRILHALWSSCFFLFSLKFIDVCVARLCVSSSSSQGFYDEYERSFYILNLSNAFCHCRNPHVHGYIRDLEI